MLVSFAFRNHGDVKKKVMRIREGGSNADMVQDLLDLAVLGEKYPEPLAAIHFDMEKLSQARELSHSMSELLAASRQGLYAAGRKGPDYSRIWPVCVLERRKQIEKIHCVVFFKLLILSAPMGFDPPRGLFTLPNDFSPSTTTFHPPRCDFLCPQRDLTLHNRNFHAHN